MGGPGNLEKERDPRPVDSIAGSAAGSPHETEASSRRPRRWIEITPPLKRRPYMKPLYLVRQTAEWTWLIMVMKSNTGRSVTFWMAAA